MIMTSLKCYTVDDPKIQKCHFSKKYDQSNKVVICSKTAVLQLIHFYYWYWLSQRTLWLVNSKSSTQTRKVKHECQLNFIKSGHNPVSMKIWICTVQINLQLNLLPSNSYHSSKNTPYEDQLKVPVYCSYLKLDLVN